MEHTRNTIDPEDYIEVANYSCLGLSLDRIASIFEATPDSVIKVLASVSLTKAQKMKRIFKLRDEHFSLQTISELTYVPVETLCLVISEKTKTVEVKKENCAVPQGFSKSNEGLTAEEESKELTQSREGTRGNSIQTVFQLERPDGSMYDGETKDGQMHGKGRAVWVDGRVYCGIWKQNKMHGFGVYTDQTGARYEGVFTNGTLNGQGVIVYADGTKYTGSILDSTKHGHGVEVLPTGQSSTGNWVNGKKHGDFKIKNSYRSWVEKW
jgi:hypothetical protein